MYSYKTLHFTYCVSYPWIKKGLKPQCFITSHNFIGCQDAAWLAYVAALSWRVDWDARPGMASLSTVSWGTSAPLLVPFIF